MRDGGSGLHPGSVKRPNPTYPPHTGSSWRSSEHPRLSLVILAGEMGLRRCGMDYQKEPASSMVYLWTLLYVFYLLLLDIEQLFCFRLRLCKHPGYRMILGLQAYKLQNQMMTCSRSSCSSQWFLNTPSSRNQSHPWNPRTIQNPTKMLPHCPVVNDMFQWYRDRPESWCIADILPSFRSGARSHVMERMIITGMDCTVLYSHRATEATTVTVERPGRIVSMS